MEPRDFFAGQALNGLLREDDDYSKGKNLRKLVTLAYRIADAMLEEREHLSHPSLIRDNDAFGHDDDGGFKGAAQATQAGEAKEGRKGKKARKAEAEAKLVQ
ncbi:hypothetical protein [Noviherbaspirillum galbum]|uniref:Uncharacterized protein n=1 Tax=Noviherbaspirillum galbum TaxID=2709383 RepID=A0A6B3SY38_9BURK|nr:hypothetical protein [Noviherbaspirillum galbum]NEX64166.1 hypothetical protein [Noviherbaspirillum galbum]